MDVILRPKNLPLKLLNHGTKSKRKPLVKTIQACSDNDVICVFQDQSGVKGVDCIYVNGVENDKII